MAFRSSGVKLAAHAQGLALCLPGSDGIRRRLLPRCRGVIINALHLDLVSPDWPKPRFLTSF